jgi:hypothetical protein
MGCEYMKELKRISRRNYFRIKQKHPITKEIYITSDILILHLEQSLKYKQQQNGLVV